MAAPAESAVVHSPAQTADQTLSPIERTPADMPSAAAKSENEATSSFQAINDTAVSENSTAAAKAAASPGGEAVAQVIAQTAQTSNTMNLDQISSNMEDPDGDSTTDAATYGTRSRHRMGNARPNYAEDQDMDFEMASTSSKKKPANDAIASAAITHSTTESKRAQEFARFIAVNSNGGPADSATKESTPGTPVAAASLSKKRKAPGASAGYTQTPPASNSPAPNALGKLPAPSLVARETNIMTFTKSKACLNKKGELPADDGAKLCVNGKPKSPERVICFSRLRPTPLHPAHQS